jgi:hypothetical protein
LGCCCCASCWLAGLAFCGLARPLLACILASRLAADIRALLGISWGGKKKVDDSTVCQSSLPVSQRCRASFVRQL